MASESFAAENPPPARHNEGDSESDEFHDAVETEEERPKTFHQFTLLTEDLQLLILSFIAEVPYEVPHRRSLLTHVLPYVSHHFYALCQSDYLWQEALERLIHKDPVLWVTGLQKLAPTVNQSTSLKFVQLVHQDLNEPGFLRMFQMVVERHLHFTGPVFIMSGVVRLGEGIALHFFEPRYRLLVQRVLEGFSPEFRQGAPMDAATAPTFVYAHTAPFVPTTPAVLVRVQQCTVYPNGSADVVLIPTAYVWLTRLWEAPNTGRLHYAQTLRMPTDEARQLEERSFRQPVPIGFENPLIEMLLQERGLMGGDGPMGLQGPLREMLNFLMQNGGDGFGDDEEEEDAGIPAD